MSTTQHDTALAAGTAAALAVHYFLSRALARATETATTLETTELAPGLPRRVPVPVAAVPAQRSAADLPASAVGTA